MSGWHYRKQRILNETTEGPLSDAEFLQLSHDGHLKLNTLVIHQVHTKGQWVKLSQIPDAKKRLHEGASVRRFAKEDVARVSLVRAQRVWLHRRCCAALRAD